MSTPARVLTAMLAIVLVAASPPAPAAAVGGPGNVVVAVNRTDGRFAVQANIQLNRVPGLVAAPLNYAFASSSCTDCQTLAVALQLDLASTDARYIAPQNAAVASNEACLRCVTVAHAVQVFYTVDDPTVIPPGVQAALRDLDAVLREVSTDPRMTLPEAEARVDAVIAEFSAIAAAVAEQRTVAP